ncbi:MAG: hypothetical protein AABN33_04045 [Acidobacteriota bacterium]
MFQTAPFVFLQGVGEKTIVLLKSAFICVSTMTSNVKILQSTRWPAQMVVETLLLKFFHDFEAPAASYAAWFAMILA